MNPLQKPEDHENIKDDLISSNFQSVEETSLLTNNDSDNPLLKQLNRLLALKNLHQLDSRLNKTKEAEDQLLKREERKIVNRLQKENLEVTDLIEKKSKLRVRFDILSKNSVSSFDSDYEVYKKSEGDVQSEENSDDGSEKGSWPEYPRELCNLSELEEDHAKQSDQPRPSSLAFDRVSLDSNIMNEEDKNTVKHEFREIKEFGKPNFSDCTENKIDDALKLKDEKSFFDKTQKSVTKRPFLKKGSGMSRFYRKTTQTQKESEMVPKTKTVSLPNTKQIVVAVEEYEHSALDSDKLSSSSDEDDEVVEDFTVDAHRLQQEVTNDTFLPSSRTSKTADQQPLQKSTDIPSNIFPDKPAKLELTDNYGAAHAVDLKNKDSVTILQFGQKNHETDDISSLSSYTESDSERDPELNLFELMESMSTQPGFSKFSELAKKFVAQEYINQDVAEDLKNVNRKLMEDKKNLESVHENLLKDKISLLKIIEELQPDLEALRQEKDKIQRKIVLDVRLEKESLEQEKEKWLQEKEILLKSTNSLRNEQKALISESKSLEEENQRLANERLQLLKEKEDWNNEKNEILSTKQDLIAEQHKLLKEKESLLLEMKIKNRKDGSADSSPKSETRLTNGGMVVTLENGTTKYTNKDGCDFKYVYQNGDVKELRPDGTIEYFYRESNIWHTTRPDGTIVMKFSNGQVETVDPDGTKTVVYPNEIVRKIRPNGTEEYIYPDDTIAVSEVNGVKCITFTNGEKEYHHEHFTKRVYPDGTVKTLFEDGSSETKWVNGRVRVKDSTGNLIYDTGEPSGSDYF